MKIYSKIYIKDIGAKLAYAQIYTKDIGATVFTSYEIKHRYFPLDTRYFISLLMIISRDNYRSLNFQTAIFEKHST